MWEISNSLQTQDFLRSIVLGVILCVIYCFFAALRKAGLNSTISVFFEDLIFLLIASPICFLFLLATTNGEVRMYVLIGALVGFFLFKFTLFKLFLFLFSKFFIYFYKGYCWIISLFLRILGCFYGCFSKIFSKTLKNFKKPLNTLKKGLKNQ